MSLSGLPTEILIKVFAELTAPEFLRLTSANHFFHGLRDEHTFWRLRAQDDFRVPPQPLLETQGERWHWLYKALQTQSEVFTWGDDKRGNLGRPDDAGSDLRAGYPMPMTGVSGPRGIGKIVDVQCGGWSTVLMNSHGKLFATGVINGELGLGRLGSTVDIRPVALPLKAHRQWLLDISHRTMNQFSMGRKRLLALSDHGEVIEWISNFSVAGEILSADHMHPEIDYTNEPRATQVVAGWAHGSAFYPGHGIFYWQHIMLPESTMSKLNHIVSGSEETGSINIPGTQSSRNALEGSLEERMGNVKKYIVLEHHIIIITDKDKLFSWRTTRRPSDQGGGTDTQSVEPTELKTFYRPSGTKVVDIQGSFRTFGVFMSNDTILLGRLREADLENTPRFADEFGEKFEVQLPQPEIRPELQKAGIMQLAFGDFHYHALHYNGEVTSYGSELDACGALGFGRHTSMFRGVKLAGTRGDLEVHPQSDGHRRIWFEPEKFMFLCVLLDKFIATLREDDALKRIWETKPQDFRAVYSEWVEQEGLDWSSGPLARRSRMEAGNEQPAYFPIRIAAAGWSSAAVVLVDADRAERDRQQYLLPRHQKEKLPGSGDNASFAGWIKNLSQRLQTMNLADMVGGWIERVSCDEADQYLWSEMEFPRLRLPDDNSLVHDKEPAAWKFSEPSWI